MDYQHTHDADCEVCEGRCTAVLVHLSIGRQNAYALAELCKRIGYRDCRANAVSDDEAHRMIHAMDLLRSALAEIGVVVR